MINWLKMRYTELRHKFHGCFYNSIYRFYIIYLHVIIGYCKAISDILGCNKEQKNIVLSFIEVVGRTVQFDTP